MRDIKPIPGYDRDYGLLLASLQETSKKWRRELGKVPPDTVTWQPVTDGHSIGAILLHMADVESYWVGQFCLGLEPDPEEERLLLSAETDQYHAMWPQPPSEPIEWYFEIQDRIRTRTLEHAKALGPAGTGVRRDNSPFLSFRWVLHHVQHHEAYHGGQAVMLKEMHRVLAKRKKNSP